MSAALLLTFLASLALTAAWHGYSLHQKRLDVPNARSSHRQPTPTSGGLGFCVVSLLGVLALWGTAALNARAALLLSLSAILALLGFADDSVNLGIRVRLLVQAAVVLLLLCLIAALPPLHVGVWQLAQPVVLSALLFFYGIWQINFYNFMDGIDGLAVSQGVFVSLSLAWFCADAGAPALSVAALGLACTLAGFAFYNLPPARLFMGDVGSNFLGYAFFALGLLAVRDAALDYWTYLILMSGFLVDSTVTLLARMSSGAVWYHGHRSHAYQLLARYWGSHAKVVVVYTGVNVMWLLPLALLSQQYVNQGWWIALLAWGPLALAVWRIRRQCMAQDQATVLSQ
ncbi:MAG: glycosyltransferase family 4 protein [Pseudomonadales bacterium]|jgi:Fuc2NAc and GlcNAc transferase|nr:glycosyltransferase family 4 protein [Pseudomonadales bacterium]